MKKNRMLIRMLIVIAIFAGSFGVVFATGKIIMNMNSESMVSASSGITSEKKDGRSPEKEDGDSSDTESAAPSSENEGEDKKESAAESEDTQCTESSEEPSEVEDSESTDESSEKPSDSKQPEELISFLSSTGTELSALDSISCSQLITVDSSGNTAQISMYQKSADGTWSSAGLDTSGFVGSNGVSASPYEGSYETPAGLFPVGDAFYIDSAPETGLNSFQVTQDTYWVDDPDSRFYNQRVEGTGEMDWNSAEHMIDYYASYKYGFVINFNMNPIVPGKGSAIFFHISSRSTAGCVGVPEYMMLAYLKALDAGQNPYILIR